MRRKKKKGLLNADFIKQLIIFIAVTIVVVLGFRIFFRMISAQGQNRIVDYLYYITDYLIQPFTGIFSNQWKDSIPEFELTTVFAMLIYPLLGFGLLQLVEMLKSDKD